MSRYKTDIKFYREIRDEFLGNGTSIREIALQKGMEPSDVRDFLAWLRTEYDLERAIRTAKVIAQLTAGAEVISFSLADPNCQNRKALQQELRDMLQLIERTHSIAEGHREARQKRPTQPRGFARPSERRIEREDDPGPDDDEPQGGLEAEILRHAR